MSHVESISHSGTNVLDLVEAEEFYADVFGGWITNRINFNTDDARRGRSVHTAIAVGDWLFAVVLPVGQMPLPPEDDLRGTNNFRHGFHVRQATLPKIMDRLKARGVPFEGPVQHPEGSPLGESVYFKDPGGNYLEVCWRRDRDALKHGMRLDVG